MWRRNVSGKQPVKFSVEKHHRGIQRRLLSHAAQLSRYLVATLVTSHRTSRARIATPSINMGDRFGKIMQRITPAAAG